MLLIDTNVLVNMFRKESFQHATCLSWLNEVYRSKTPFGFSELVGVAFLRTVTNPHAFPNANTIEEAVSGLSDITSRREFMWFNAGHDHWPIFKKLTQSALVKGNLVNDAWLAAIAIEGNYELVTLDRDFARFPGLRWRHPS